MTSQKANEEQTTIRQELASHHTKMHEQVNYAYRSAYRG